MNQNEGEMGFHAGAIDWVRKLTIHRLDVPCGTWPAINHIYKCLSPWDRGPGKIRFHASHDSCQYQPPAEPLPVSNEWAGELVPDGVACSVSQGRNEIEAKARGGGVMLAFRCLRKMLFSGSALSIAAGTALGFAAGEDRITREVRHELVTLPYYGDLGGLFGSFCRLDGLGEFFFLWFVHFRILGCPA